MLYGTTIFLGSFLLFLVQPMVGRTLLPAFGGTAAVWVVCLCAFQTLLLAGYLHAHYVGAAPGRRRGVHLMLVAISAVWAFCACRAWGWLGAGAAGAAVGGAAPWRALLSVVALCGVPYVALSANSSLVQSLAADAGAGRGAYRLYSVSNIGSLCGLLAYPAIMEPFVAVGAQWRMFGAGVALYAFLLAVLVRRAPALTRDGPSGGAESRRATDLLRNDSVAQDSPAPVRSGGLAAAVLLPALSTFLLDALTTHVTLDVMPMPMMWCLLLGIFLASYIVGFSGWAERNVRNLGLAAMASVLVLCAMIGEQARKPFGSISQMAIVAAHCIFLAAGCTFIHAWLYSSRPGERGLTRFYLLGATGGAVGGIAASLVAPMVFDKVTEWPIALTATALATVGWFAFRARRCALAAVAAVAMGAASLWLWSRGIGVQQKPSVYRARGFYGTIDVLESKARNGSGEGFVREFSHGTTVHGVQALLPGAERMPTAYYVPQACGWAVTAHPKYRSGQPMRVSLVGMGVGVMFCYGREGDYYRAYEISPDVVRVATNTNLFTFVSGCPANVDIVQMDARKGLEDEKARGVEPYDVIVVDAFTGDNIPYHLSTMEAFRLYFSMLKPDGVLCVNISNWHLGLEPFMRALGEAFDVPLLGLRSDNDFAHLAFAAKTAFFCRQPQNLAPPPIGPNCHIIDFNQLPAMSSLPTDEKGSFIGLLRVW